MEKPNYSRGPGQDPDMLAVFCGCSWYFTRILRWFSWHIIKYLHLLSPVPSGENHEDQCTQPDTRHREDDKERSCKHRSRYCHCRGQRDRLLHHNPFSGIPETEGRIEGLRNRQGLRSDGSDRLKLHFFIFTIHRGPVVRESVSPWVFRQKPRIPTEWMRLRFFAMSPFLGWVNY